MNRFTVCDRHGGRVQQRPAQTGTDETQDIGFPQINQEEFLQ